MKTLDQVEARTPIIGLCATITAIGCYGSSSSSIGLAALTGYSCYGMSGSGRPESI